MILIAGGQNDPNLLALVRRLTRRSLPFHSLLVGPDTPPVLRIDIQAETFELDGEPIQPSAYFIRHDVFLYDTPDLTAAHSHAHNWYHAVRGWAESRHDARVFNRRTSLRENNKVHNLIEAMKAGLVVPRTIATNEFSEFSEQIDCFIQKPVGGGEYTTLLSELDARRQRTAPRFVQPRLRRPEIRIYRIGPQLLAFELQSPELDYRQTQDVTIRPVPVPESVGEKLLRLCDRLELDFGAADFMIDDRGDLNFLEVNSQPMFAAFDRQVDGRLCDAILDHLVGETARLEARMTDGDARVAELAQ